MSTERSESFPPSATTAKLFGESPATWGDVIVAMCERADADGCFFGEHVAPRVLEYTSMYTAAQRKRIEEAGFSVSLSDGADPDGGNGSSSSSTSHSTSDGEAVSRTKGRSMRFWGSRGRHRLVARLRTLAGPSREFALRKPKGDTLKKRQRLMGTATFSCKTCQIRHVASLTRLARTDLTADAFKCLCSAGFSSRDALSRRMEISWRNLCAFVKSKRPDTKLVTTHDTFTKDYSSVVLRCKHCQSEKRVQPRDVFGPEAECTACQQPSD